MKLKAPTIVQLAGRGSVKLTPSQHLATGGEGIVYRMGHTAIKLYLDPNKMKREKTADKITLLAGLSHPYIVTPLGLVTDQQGTPIGWYMDYVDGEPLARSFTNDWRQRMKFGNREAATIAERMRQVVLYAHSQNAIMADANELNWTIVLANGSGPEPRALDVDSWSIGRWPAKVIMPSIRDWHSHNLTQSTDWFAWGVVTFQLFTGIHPYKGMLNGYKPNELTRRMQENASVFAPGVRLNRAVRDFSCIPGPLLDWYEAVFQKGLREIPPSPLSAAPAKAIRRPAYQAVTGNALEYDQLYNGTSDQAIRAFACGIVLLASGNLYDLASKRIVGSWPYPNTEVIAADDGWLAARIEGGTVNARYIGRNLQATDIPTTIAARQLVRSGNRLFAVTGQGLAELALLNIGRPQLAIGQTWGALPSTRWLDGIGVQDTFGTTHLIVPTHDGCSQVRTPELDRLRVINGVAAARFASLIVIDAQGTYLRYQLAFDKDYSQYSITSEIVDGPEQNLAILPRGVCAAIASDGELVIFVPSNGKEQRVADKDATTSLRLANWDETVIGIREGDVYQVKLR